MTQSPPFPLLQLPAFKDLSSEGAARLQQETRGLKFDLGHQLVEDGEIPARVLVLLQGQARLVGEQRGRMTTVGKFGPGSILGAASLLCGHPCENVVAAQEVVAAAIPDETWLHLYKTESRFRRWCDGQLWPQELQFLLETLIAGSANAEISSLQLLQTHYKACRHCAPTAEAIRAAQDEGVTVFLSSSWGEASPGRLVQADSDLPPTDRFAPRLVALPQEVMDALGGDASLTTTASAVEDESTSTLTLLPASEEEGSLPPVSHYSPERNVVDSLRLIRADGPIDETLACFQMLAQLMKLPFRRDSIEKVLRDNLRRGLTPNLQLCGQLAASLGLHVMAARVPASAGTRLQVPSMIPWKGGFALVVASNERGLKLPLRSTAW